MINRKNLKSVFSHKIKNRNAAPDAKLPRRSGFNHTLRLKKINTVPIAASLIIIIVLTACFIFYTYNNEATPNPDNTQPIATISSGPTPANTTPAPLNPIQQIGGPLNNGWSESISPKDTSYQVITQANPNINATTWYRIAGYAWRYYQPGIGVDSTTGLPWTSVGSPFITDWDIGVYIQAVIDSEKLGLIKDNDTWGFNYRIDKVLTWLETRELNNASYPYWFYQANDGKVWHENSDKVSGDYIDVTDTGRLFVALSNLKDFSQFSNRVDNLVNNKTRTDYTKIISSVKQESYTSQSIYNYYLIKGFESFWPIELAGASSRVLDNMYKAGTIVTPEGVALPKAKIAGDPLLCSLFEINNNDPRLEQLVNQTYYAHEAFYNSTKKYRAFGEGPQFSTDWQWEWITLPDGRTWTILDAYNNQINQTPIIYTKIALGFMAIQNTTFTRGMAMYLEQCFSDCNQGYPDGTDEQGKVLPSIGSLTNGLILDASLYYIVHN